LDDQSKTSLAVANRNNKASSQGQSGGAVTHLDPQNGTINALLLTWAA